MFANGPGDRGSIPSRVIPKTPKMVLDISLLNIQHYKLRINGNWINPGKGVAPSPTPRCSSYWKKRVHVAVNNGCLTCLSFKHCNLILIIQLFICLHIVKWLNSSIWPMDGTQIGTTALGQSGPGSNGNERVLPIPHNSRTGTSPSEMQSVYSTAPDDRVAS